LATLLQKLVPFFTQTNPVWKHSPNYSGKWSVCHNWLKEGDFPDELTLAGFGDYVDLVKTSPLGNGK
jgi:hypothetical protein